MNRYKQLKPLFLHTSQKIYVVITMLVLYHTIMNSNLCIHEYIAVRICDTIKCKV
jgi:hypothetical protein